MIEALPGLKVLNLSGNPFLRLGAEFEAPSVSFSSQLETLILNECFITWKQALQVVDHLSTISELQVCLNKVENLMCPSLSGHAFHHLEVRS